MYRHLLDSLTVDPVVATTWFKTCSSPVDISEQNVTARLGAIRTAHKELTETAPDFFRLITGDAVIYVDSDRIEVPSDKMALDFIRAVRALDIADLIALIKSGTWADGTTDMTDWQKGLIANLVLDAGYGYRLVNIPENIALGTAIPQRAMDRSPRTSAILMMVSTNNPPTASISLLTSNLIKAASSMETSRAKVELALNDLDPLATLIPAFDTTAAADYNRAERKMRLTPPAAVSNAVQAATNILREAVHSPTKDAMLTANVTELNLVERIVYHVAVLENLLIERTILIDIDRFRDPLLAVVDPTHITSKVLKLTNAVNKGPSELKADVTGHCGTTHFRSERSLIINFLDNPLFAGKRQYSDGLLAIIKKIPSLDQDDWTETAVLIPEMFELLAELTNNRPEAVLEQTSFGTVIETALGIFFGRQSATDIHCSSTAGDALTLISSFLSTVPEDGVTTGCFTSEAAFTKESYVKSLIMTIMLYEVLGVFNDTVVEICSLSRPQITLPVHPVFVKLAQATKPQQAIQRQNIMDMFNHTVYPYAVASSIHRFMINALSNICLPQLADAKLTPYTDHEFYSSIVVAHTSERKIMLNEIVNAHVMANRMKQFQAQVAMLGGRQLPGTYGPIPTVAQTSFEGGVRYALPMQLSAQAFSVTDPIIGILISPQAKNIAQASLSSQFARFLNNENTKLQPEQEYVRLLGNAYYSVRASVSVGNYYLTAPDADLIVVPDVGNDHTKISLVPAVFRWRLAEERRIRQIKCQVGEVQQLYKDIVKLELTQSVSPDESLKKKLFIAVRNRSLGSNVLRQPRLNPHDLSPVYAYLESLGASASKAKLPEIIEALKQRMIVDVQTLRRLTDIADTGVDIPCSQSGSSLSVLGNFVCKALSFRANMPIAYRPFGNHELVTRALVASVTTHFVSHIVNNKYMKLSNIESATLSSKPDPSWDTFAANSAFVIPDPSLQKIFYQALGFIGTTQTKKGLGTFTPIIEVTSNITSGRYLGVGNSEVTQMLTTPLLQPLLNVVFNDSLYAFSSRYVPPVAGEYTLNPAAISLINQNSLDVSPKTPIKAIAKQLALSEAVLGALFHVQTVSEPTGIKIVDATEGLVWPLITKAAN